MKTTPVYMRVSALFALSITLLATRPVMAAGIVSLSVASSDDGAYVPRNSIIDWTISAGVSSGDNLGLALVSVDLVQGGANPATLDLTPAPFVPGGMTGFSRPDGVSNPGPGGAGTGYGGTQTGTPGAMNLTQIGGAQNNLGVPVGAIGTDVDVDSGIGQLAQQIITTGSFTAPTTPGVYTFSLQSPVANTLTTVNAAPTASLVDPATAVLAAPSISFTVCRAGDMDASGVTDLSDIGPFAAALLDPTSVTAAQFCSADTNSDGLVNGGDVDSFVDEVLP